MSKRATGVGTAAPLGDSAFRATHWRQLHQRITAILDCLGDFGHAIRTSGNWVFELDGRLNVPFVVPDQAQDFLNRCVALAEWEVFSVMQLPVFNMNMR